MPIRLLKTRAAFAGVVSVEEADALQGWLGEKPGRRVDLKRCTHLHPASLQVLLSAHIRPATMPDDPTLAAWLVPLFSAN
ncbi:hypothetical protein [Novosphingobium sp. FKTRR1]|uniref:hypothetical protein n=1 Tax=unclassified Novosphingobium TaxID=2644732 RepID=UPI001CF0229E|nr:hypothetical protein [Novosphingobium sp. FKTRR1]